jgi:hypothetical protein
MHRDLQKTFHTMRTTLKTISTVIKMSLRKLLLSNFNPSLTFDLFIVSQSLENVHSVLAMLLKCVRRSQRALLRGVWLVRSI